MGERGKPTIHSSTQEEKFLLLKRPFVVPLIIHLIEKPLLLEKYIP